jgi:hypothetical protein
MRLPADPDAPIGLVPTARGLDWLRDQRRPVTMGDNTMTMTTPDTTTQGQGADILPLRPPAGIPVHDERPLPLPQFGRREALRLAVEHHEGRRSSDAAVLETAHRFAEFIRNGEISAYTRSD